MWTPNTVKKLEALLQLLITDQMKCNMVFENWCHKSERLISDKSLCTLDFQSFPNTVPLITA